MRKVLTAICAFLLAFFVFLTATAAVAYATLLNPDFMVQVLSKQGFTDQIYAEYAHQLEYLAEPAGVDAQMLKDTIGKAEMAQTLRQTVYYAYDQNHPKAAALNTESVRTRFVMQLTKYAEGQGYAIEEEVQAGIDNIANLAVGEYCKYATLPFMSQIGGFFNSVKNVVTLALWAGLGITVVLALCLFLGKGRPVALKWSGLVWALSGAGLLSGVWSVAVLLFGKLEYLNVQIKSLYLFMQGYIKDILIVFMVVGGVLLLAALLVYFLLYRPQSKKA